MGSTGVSKGTGEALAGTAEDLAGDFGKPFGGARNLGRVEGSFGNRIVLRLVSFDDRLRSDSRSLIFGGAGTMGVSIGASGGNKSGGLPGGPSFGGLY